MVKLTTQQYSEISQLLKYANKTLGTLEEVGLVDPEVEPFLIALKTLIKVGQRVLPTFKE